jgi:hypothetical protein
MMGSIVLNILTTLKVIALCALIAAGLTVAGPEEETRLFTGLQKKFNLTPERAERLFERVPIVVKKGISKAEMERYVKDLVGAFGQDQRVLLWDLYNEPGNSSQGVKSLPLLNEVFIWARQIEPIQPLTCGIWSNEKTIVDFQLQQSDIISFHNYSDADSLTDEIAQLQRYGRLLIR